MSLDYSILKVLGLCTNSSSSINQSIRIITLTLALTIITTRLIIAPTPLNTHHLIIPFLLFHPQAITTIHNTRLPTL